MVRIGYHASHEQFPPSLLLDAVRAAEAAGFQAAMSADHFHPWSAKRQAQSGFAWSWLGAAMQATRLPFGVVTSPVGFRYHPAIIAQAAATLGEMFPGRFWMALGTGENLNEHIVGERWPSKPERNERLGAAVEIIRALFAGETVSRREPIRVDRAKLYTRPREPPRLVAAALSEPTAAWAASWADALITINMPGDRTAKVVDAFRRAGGAGKPVILQAHLSWAATEDEAMRHAREGWGTNVFAGPVSENVATPEEFDELAIHVRDDDVRRNVHVSADPEAHLRWIEDLARVGFEEIYLHQVGPDQRGFVETFGKRVLPALHEG